MTMELDEDTVRQRVSDLNRIVERLDEMLDGAWHLPGRQTPSRWTPNPAAMEVVEKYRTRLVEAEQTLRRLRGRVQPMAEELEASAAAVTNLDEHVQDNLDELMRKVANAPEPRPFAHSGHGPIPV